MNWLQTYEEYTKDSEAIDLYHLWTGISCVAAVIERKAWVRLMADELYPNMYIILVGPPAARKGSAMTLGEKLIKQIDTINLAPEKTTGAALLYRMPGLTVAYTEGEKQKEQSAITCFSKELKTLLGDRAVDMMDLLCDLFDANMYNDWTKDTLMRSEETIKYPWLNILGATTPQLFRRPEIAQGIDIGFMSRCILIWSEGPRFRRNKIEDLDRHLALKEELVKGLRYIHDIIGEFRFAPDARDCYDAWYHNLPLTQDTIKALSAYYERRNSHLLKLCIILSAAEGGNDMTITLHNLKSAFRMLNEAEKYMPLALGGAGMAMSAKVILDVTKMLEMRREPVTLGEIFNELWRDHHSDDIKKALEALVTMGKVKCELGLGGKQVFTWIGEL